jgi:hypothetical protein
MSEYQYYEFQTIDRPLSAEEQAALRHAQLETLKSTYQKRPS